MDPVVVGTVGARPLQGREPEMALLASLIDGVGSKGASLVLRGEPGIGKSRLLREAITLAEGRNVGRKSVFWEECLVEQPIKQLATIGDATFVVFAILHELVFDILIIGGHI